MSERWLKTGEPITVVGILGDETAPMAMRVKTEYTGNGFRERDGWQVAYWYGEAKGAGGTTWTSGPLRFEEEGIRWARGHDEETVRSLVAASKLASSG